MTQALPMSTDEHPLINPAEATHLETEADRVFAPLAADLPAHVMALLRDVFIITAATDPDAIRARKRASEAGPVARTGEELKALVDDGTATANRKAR